MTRVLKICKLRFARPRPSAVVSLRSNKKIENSNFEIFFWYILSCSELNFKAMKLGGAAKCVARNADHFKKKVCMAIWSTKQVIAD